jgi:hypothetical protein
LSKYRVKKTFSRLITVHFLLLTFKAFDFCGYIIYSQFVATKVRSGEMSAKKLCRPTEMLKDLTIRARMDNETVKKLDICVERLYPNRSEVIRQGINLIYNELTKNQ